MIRTLFALCCAAALAAGDASNATITIDGSTTVYPITVAVAERYVAENPQANVEVLVSGSSTGIRRLLAGEISIADSSRAINADEQAKAKAAGIEFVELAVAYDGLTVVVNRANTFVDHLTVDELKRMWQNDSTVKTWKDVRPAWPDQPIGFVSAGHENGTFDYFTEAINGKTRNQRSDIPYVEAMGDRIQGVIGNPQGMSYMGFVYYLDSASMLRAVPIDGGKGPVMPAADTIQNGTYQPLSRPLFIYINKAALSRPEVASFADFYLRSAQKVVKEVGYVPLGDAVMAQVRARLSARTSGTLFPTSHDVGRMAELLGAPLVAAAAVAASSAPAKSAAKSADSSAVHAAPTVAATTATPSERHALAPAVIAPAAMTSGSAPAPTSVSVPVAAPIVSAPVAVSEPARLVAPVRASYGDAFATSVTQVGTSSLAMARTSLDPNASLDDLDRQGRQLQNDLGSMQKALPDRRLIEAAVASGSDGWRTAAVGLIQLRASGADASALREAVRGVTETTQRDVLALIEAAHTPVEITAAHNRETAAGRFRDACSRWLDDVATP